MENVLLFGGTFNPPHLGHIELTDRVRKRLNIDKVILIPLGNPPHKVGMDIEDAKHRVKMLELAIENKDSFEVSRIEVERKGYTYTIDTLKEFDRLYHDRYNFFYLIGADTLEQLTTWKDFEEVFKLCSFVVVLRKGYTKKKAYEIANMLELQYGADIKILDIGNIDVSSTKVREMIRRGESIDNLVPNKVAEYIRSNNLYAERENSYEL